LSGTVLARQVVGFMAAGGGHETDYLSCPVRTVPCVSVSRAEEICPEFIAQGNCHLDGELYLGARYQNAQYRTSTA